MDNDYYCDGSAGLQQQEAVAVHQEWSCVRDGDDDDDDDDVVVG